MAPRTRASRHLIRRTIRVPSLPCGRAYIYKPIPKGYIRLLTIKSFRTQSPTFQLDTYPQVYAPEYDAVSYCWGEDQTLTSINCDDFDLTLRYSLFIALQYLTERSHPRRPLWIDAICLNQDDNHEKAIQVPLMHEIYKHATRTVVWLGEPDSDTSMALDFMAEVTSHLKQDGDPESIDEYKRPREWKALREYLSRPWFNRLWVVQEAVLSQHIEILCYSRNYRMISWQHLIHFLTIVEEDDLDTSLMEGSYHSGMNVQNLEARRLEVGKDGYLTFMGVCFLGEDRLCREPVDRVWALLGLLKFELLAVIQQADIIDYSEPGKRNYWKTYLAVMKLLHREYVSDFNWLVFNVLSFPKNPSLPSWCPDFNVARRKEGIQIGRDFRSGYVDGDDLLPPATELDPTTDALWIIGFIISEVTAVTSLALGFEENWQPWLEQCEKLTQQVLRGPQEVAGALGETLVLADEDIRKQYSEPWDQYYQCLRGRYEATDRYDRKCPHGEAEKHESYEADALSACRSSKFFITSDRRIGLASGDVCVGDKICVFIGTEALFVLRGTQHETVKDDEGQQADHEPRPESSQETFKLIGDAYVQGVMFGEAFTAEGRGPERKFKII